MSHVIRVDREVKDALDRERLSGERNYSQTIRRITERERLEERLRKSGLGPKSYARLQQLRTGS